MQLEKINEDIWTVPMPLKVFQFIELNTRMTIIKLQDGSLLLHSPIKYTPELGEAINHLGNVQYLIAPNCFHHLFIGTWQEQYPNAKIFAPNGLIKKRPDLKLEHFLNEPAQLPWLEEIAVFPILGMPMVQEFLFYHQKTQTMIITDFAFFLPNSTGFTSFYAKLNAVKETVQTPVLFKMAVSDKKAMKESLVPLQNLKIQHISLCHHEILSQKAQEQFSNLLEFWK